MAKSGTNKTAMQIQLEQKATGGKRALIDETIGWIDLFVILLLVSYLIFLGVQIGSINKRIYPLGSRNNDGSYQTLATTCYVDNKVSNSNLHEWHGIALVNGLKKKVDILDERKDEVKISYRDDYFWGTTTDKWIPKSDYFPYPTKEQLAEMWGKFKK